jgi:hypothetical protein
MIKGFCIIIFTILIIFSNCQFKDLGNYDFQPNIPVDINNPLLWQIKAKCSIKATDDSDQVKGVMKKGTGTLNGQSVGSGVELTLKNGDTLSLTASALAAVEITNLGTNTVSASCSLAEETIGEIEYIKLLLNQEELAFLK